MKRKTQNLFLATMVGLTVSANGAISFTEDFSDNTAQGMALGTGHGSPTTTTTGNFTITSGSNSRIYLGTTLADYDTVDFTFEVDVTVPAAIFSDPWTIAFLGMGSPNHNSGAFGEPTTGSNIVMALRADDLGNVGNLSSRNNGTFAAAFNGLGLTVGTHGMRMEWDASDDLATFKFDLNNDGSYEPASTFTRTNATFNGTNSQLFVGGGNGLSFDNINVSVVPEPSAALLGGLGVLALLRRRRN